MMEPVHRNPPMSIPEQHTVRRYALWAANERTILCELRPNDMRSVNETCDADYSAATIPLTRKI